MGSCWICGIERLGCFDLDDKRLTVKLYSWTLIVVFILLLVLFEVTTGLRLFELLEDCLLPLEHLIKAVTNSFAVHFRQPHLMRFFDLDMGSSSVEQVELNGIRRNLSPSEVVDDSLKHLIYVLI